jgi:hypothetical protein
MFISEKLFENVKKYIMPQTIFVIGSNGKKRASTNTSSPFYTNKWAVAKLKKVQSLRH